MRYIALFMALLPFNLNALTVQDAHEVFRNVINGNGYTTNPKLYISNSNEINAYSDGYKIIINKGLLKFVKNKQQLAWVIGHEMAHFRTHQGSTWLSETTADKLGVQYSTKAGYKGCYGARLIKRFHGKASQTHPGAKTRWLRLECK